MRAFLFFLTFISLWTVQGCTQKTETEQLADRTSQDTSSSTTTIDEKDSAPLANAKRVDAEIEDEEEQIYVEEVIEVPVVTDMPLTDETNTPEPQEILPEDETALDDLDSEPTPTEIPTDEEEPHEKKKKDKDAKSIRSLRVFVTSERYQGNLRDEFQGREFKSGLEGADYRCQWHAENKNLKGTWRAILGDGEFNVRERIKVKGVVMNLIDGIVADDTEQFWSEKLGYAMNFDESGTLILDKEKAWTGSLPKGSKTKDAHCEFWTSASKKDRGRFGNIKKINRDWLAKKDKAISCNSKLRLYCIEQ